MKKFSLFEKDRIECKPFIKWVGGKGQLLPEINKLYPVELGKNINKYAEIFIGGGAVLFDILSKYKLEGTKFFRVFEEISKDITKINLYDIKDYHTSEIRDFFILRIGKYRAIFKIDKNIITILVLDIGSRGDIYKK